MSKRVIIAGASGLIGSSLMSVALEHPEISEVLILVRRELPMKHPKLKQIKVSYEDMEDVSGHLQGDVIFCCLGTTRQKTPDKTEYRKVDFEYPLKLAKVALQNNIPQYHLISALGANKKSVIFYSRLKGEIEEAVSALSIESLHIYQPSLLTGKRSEHRLGENISIKLMKLINPFLIGSFRKYRSIEASTVASAMLNQSLKDMKGKFFYTSDKIEKLA